VTDRNIPAIVWRLITFFVILVAIGGFFESQTRVYLTSANIHSLFRDLAVQGIVAIGLTFVIVVRHFDLSLPGIASFGAMTLGCVLAQGDGDLLLSVGCCVGVGLASGLMNGFIVGVIRLPDVVATIATGSIAYGLSFIYNGGSSYSDNFFTSGILDINDNHYLGIDEPVLILIAVAVVASILLHATRYGEAFYATGENPLAAKLSGIPIRVYLLAAFGICAALSCLAMVLFVASTGAAYVSSGNQILLPAYTAVYLGAALFETASIPATVAGILLTAMLLNGFTALSMPYYYSDAIVSFVLILAIATFDPALVGALAKAPMSLLGSRSSAT
jgi:ribose/xylose/arabinose/galactoside ABC-type transport system permease subunit